MITPVFCHEDTNDPTSRRGKQVVEIRVDLLPPSVTDLLFVISPTNSRDLSKFTSLRCVVVDAESEGNEILADNEVGYHPKFGDESATLVSIYRLEDELTQKHALEMGYAVELSGDQKAMTAEFLEILASPEFPSAISDTLGVIVALIYLIIIGLPARAPRDPAVDDGPTTNLLIFMCLVYALVHVTSDQYIPNLPKMGRVLHGSQFVMSGSLQYTILLKGLVGLMAAWCSDRVGRRPMLLAATLLMMVTCIMCGCATRVEWFLASRLLQGVAESVEPVIVAMARDYASEAKQRLKLIGILECMDFVGCSISPVFGAWIASRYNWRMPFFILSVAWAFLSFYGFTQLRESAPEANHKTAPNLSRILGNPSLRWLLLTESCILAGYLLENTFGCSPLATALVILGYGLLAAFGAVMSPHFFTGTIMACAKTTCQFFTLMGLISFMLGVFAPGLPGYVGGVYLQAISMMMAYTSVKPGSVVCRFWTVRQFHT
eukprot:g25818.t1